jgi:hypothetical protein
MLKHEREKKKTEFKPLAMNKELSNIIDPIQINVQLYFSCRFYICKYIHKSAYVRLVNFTSN